MRKAFLVVLLLLSISSFSQQQTAMPFVLPETEGLSSTVLKQVNTIMHGYVVRQQLLGMSAVLRIACVRRE
jgi:hypothetical protein